MPKEMEERRDFPGLTDKLYNQPAKTYQEVVSAFADLLEMPGTETIKVVLAALIANKMDSADPVWLFLVAPSSSAKTEFVNALDKVPSTYMLSQLTPNTFLSGRKTKHETSLLLRLPRQCTLLQKDFTTILTMRTEHRSEILGQLREIYDGKYVKETGEGRTLHWEGKMGFISGVTLEIEKAIMENSKFGDRFLYWRLPEVDEKEAMKKVFSMLYSSNATRQEIQNTVVGFLEKIDVTSKINFDQNSEEIRNLQDVTIFTMKARCSIEKDYRQKTILNIGSPEGSMRTFKQILTLAGALNLIDAANNNQKLNNVISKENLEILIKIIFDAIPSRRFKVLKSLYNYRGISATTSDIGISCGFPTDTTRMILEELVCCGLAERKSKEDAEQSTEHEWLMPFEAIKIMDLRYGSVAQPNEQTVEHEEIVF